MRFPLFFNFGSSSRVIEIIDTHDGGKREKEWERQRRAKEQLRAQITAALELHTEVAAPLERIAQPGPEPLEHRVDLNALLADIELSRAVRTAAAAQANTRLRERQAAEYEARRRAWIAQDDEEVLLLLGW